MKVDVSNREKVLIYSRIFLSVKCRKVCFIIYLIYKLKICKNIYFQFGTGFLQLLTKTFVSDRESEVDLQAKTGLPSRR